MVCLTNGLRSFTIFLHSHSAITESIGLILQSVAQGLDLTPTPSISPLCLCVCVCSQSWFQTEVQVPTGERLLTNIPALKANICSTQAGVDFRTTFNSSSFQDHCLKEYTDLPRTFSSISLSCVLSKTVAIMLRSSAVILY